MTSTSRARAHAKRTRTCPRCGRAVRGNAYYAHAKACRLKIVHFRQRYDPENGLSYTRCGYVVAVNVKTTDVRGDETCLACKTGPPPITMREV